MSGALLIMEAIPFRMAGAESNSGANIGARPCLIAAGEATLDPAQRPIGAERAQIRIRGQRGTGPMTWDTWLFLASLAWLLIVVGTMYLLFA
jgi:hypothetical protein